MAENWDGKTKGTPWGYRFFIACIRFFGVRVAYFLCIWVSFYFIFFAKKQRNALIDFYKRGFEFSSIKSFCYSAINFYKFGQIIIDRVALRTKRKSSYTHSFNNEQAIRTIADAGKGGFLISGHVGNWENAGSLVGDRITSKMNVLMLDEEVQKVKSLIENQVEELKFNVIPIKNDMSHLILIHQALKRNELIALHADRTMKDQKTIAVKFLNQKTKFPLGPFVMAFKFKVPITFVFAIKRGFHFELSATDPIIGGEHVHSPEELAEKYAQVLEEKVKKAPKQWFNFYPYFENY